jgi:DNA-binding FadR family transcriptional regulator
LDQVPRALPLHAVHDRSLADRVFDQLVSELMAERYAAGTSLPSERSLSDVFGVNRHVVREALKRLAQLDLIKMSQRGATKVLDFKRHAGLDLLAMMAEHAHGGGEVARYFLSVLEMRAAIGMDMIRLCALRAGSDVRKDLLTLSGEMRAAGTDEKVFALDLQFWERVLDGADNIAYRLSFNSLVKGAYVLGESARGWFIEEIRASDYRRPYAEAVAAGDAERAEAAVRDVMRGAVETFAASVGLSRPKKAPPRPVAKKTKPKTRR